MYMILHMLNVCKITLAKINESNKRRKDCLWKQRTHDRLENGSLSFIETLHKQ